MEEIYNRRTLLVVEDPMVPTAQALALELGATYINPVHLMLTGSSPTVSEGTAIDAVYKDVFSNNVANQLLAYLLYHDTTTVGIPKVVSKVIEEVKKAEECGTGYIVVNATLLREEDIEFIEEVIG